MTGVAWVIFLLTYLGLAAGGVPGLRIDRSGIALVGATAMLVTGVVSRGEAVRAVDWGTLALLFGMMVVVGHLRLSGFFERLADWTLARVRRPLALLAATVAVAGVLSAFLVNDVVCLALTPLVLHVAERRRLDPVPYLVGLATGANVGSTATMTGNPQNMIIGSLSHVPYLRFAARLAPVAALGLVLDLALVAAFYRRALARGVPLAPEPATLRPRRPFQRRTLAVTAAAVALFFAGLPIALVALGAAAVLLLIGARPALVYRHVDWGLLVMFAGLFVVVDGFERRVVARWGLASWAPLHAHPVALVSAVSAVLSNVVSNVPAVLVLKPIVASLARPEDGWLALAMASTLAGNLTLLGSVANLIVIEGARRRGVSVSFWEYCRVGAPLTLLTLALGVAWLAW
ncbi:MAG TPA: anion transporter [Candidatus Binatia bacterium]|nr:anion transporter [Candidatus Binatia bacterium]